MSHGLMRIRGKTGMMMMMRGGKMGKDGDHQSGAAAATLTF